ncbi:MAG TPA: sigma-70 family RNA polymerase sigma factor [Vicinamibacterales bacterium]|jgi:RNA polymerase sigma-70 factor (ECF subfamily)|nr:sigma-70 family RNA polymerase sigma factor [Vicinamibacterales bacterium]
MAPFALTIADAANIDWTVTVVRDQPAPEGEPLADLDEAGLVSAALQNRTGAFDLIVERHRRGVYQLCYRFVNNHEDASDLAQEVFLRAFKGLKAFRGQSSIATWLYRIGVNVSLNRASAKTLKTEPIDDRQFHDSRVEAAPDRLMKNEQAARVRAAVAELPRKQRAVLVLRIYHELSYQEIADIVGTSVGAAKANVFHALQNLKKRLGDEVAAGS